MELQRAREEFEAARVAVFVISHDPIGAIAQFCAEQGIELDFLSDEGSELIKRLGILNTLVQPDEAIYGIPYPGSYVLDEAGVVSAKFFNREYQVRESAPIVLREALGARPRLEGFPHVEATRPGVRVSAQLGAPDLKFRQRVDLYVRLDVEPGLHVYGPSVGDGYVPTEVRVAVPEGVTASAPRYPATTRARIGGLDTEFEVFDREVEVAIELRSDLREPGFVPLDIEIRYQACTDSECLLPEELRIRLDVPVGQLNRAPRRE